MPKRATRVVLSEKEQEALLQITRRHRREQQVVLRARIVLAAAQGPPMCRLHASGHQCGYGAPVARSLGGIARDRLETLSVAERLQDAPRPGVAPKFTAEQRCQMAALACEAPPKRDARSASGRGAKSPTN